MRARGFGLLLAILLAAGAPRCTWGQTTSTGGSGGAARGGMALGAYSGATLGLLGTMMPCNRTIAGSVCVASGASSGAALGLAMGGIIGGESAGDIDERYRNAGWGTAVGAVLGLVAWKGVRQYGWADALAVAAVGGAIGAAPRGALIGAGAGVLTGAVAWIGFDKAGLADFILFTLGGLAVGSMYDWVHGAAVAGSTEPLPGPSFSIPVGW